MGDRRIAVLVFPDEYGADLAVYTHGHGSELEGMVDDAVLTARTRLGDCSYAARIIIDQLTRSSRDSEYGFGVFPVLKGQDPERFAAGDGESTIYVDLTTGKIR